MANSFNFDVTEILAEVKNAKDIENQKSELMSMSKYDLGILLQIKSGITNHKLKMLVNKSENTISFFERFKVTDEMEKLVK
jgi:hypothetical protein